jgi:DNA-binding GntR family transcriptional regulator
MKSPLTGGVTHINRRRSMPERRVLREEIRDRLMQDILEGRRAPGDRIVETRVAQEFNVSQGPVREALRDLELFGFVISSPFRGSVVRETSVEELVKVYPVRAVVEGLAAKDAATHISKAGLRRLERLLQTMRQAARRKDQRACVDADLLFHLTIVEASGNWLLKQFWERMRLANTTSITVATTKHSLFEIAERHEPLLKALKARNPKLAERVMRHHIEEAGNWLRTDFEGARMQQGERRTARRPPARRANA